MGIDHDTAEFAVESIRRWWREMGATAYPGAKRLLITADCGGSNGYRVRLWRLELQKLADELKIPIQVTHLPPGTGKWNKIEHRMFCHITANWRGRPLISREVVVNLIGATTTREGLHIKATLDENSYQKGLKVSDEDLATLVIERDDFHGEWNYRLKPRDVVAYSTAKWPPIPRQSGHRFHANPATRSTARRPPIPRQSGHLGGPAGRT